MNQKQPNRYPGVQPFQKEQSHLFFGRDEEIETLYNLILLEKLVVLFGKSGYGKSSILNAGVLPKLDEENKKSKRKYIPVRIRFNAWSETSDSLISKFEFHLISALQENDNVGHAVLTGDNRIPTTLWSLLKFSKPSPDTIFILIFDQFEEFFTYPEDQQQTFKRQLAELLYADIPIYLKQNEEKHSLDELSFLRQKIDVKTIFAIRSDRMSDLDRLKDKLPMILHKRCELRALNKVQAKDALVEPARKNGDFISPNFEWSEGALDRILYEFSHDKQGREVGVEAFLLQVLAQNIESQVVQGKIIDRAGSGQIVVFPEDLPIDLSNIYSEYYQNKIAELPLEQQLPARKLIEDGLTFSYGDGDFRRVSVDADVLMQQYGADIRLLKLLENTFLLRREVNTTGGWNYELSHDTLLKAVIEGQRERRIDEAMEFRIKEMAAEAEKLAKEQEEIENLVRPPLLFVGIVSVIMLIICFSLLFLFYQFLENPL